MEAIASAAANDERISEGKVLSEREEAILQALELITRSADEIVWVKGTALREKIRSPVSATLVIQGEFRIRVV